MKKKKILWYSDNPVYESGFAQVAKQVLKSLCNAGYEVVVAGIGKALRENYDESKHPYRIISVWNNEKPVDIFGFDYFVYLLNTQEFDILVTFNDLSTINALANEIQKVKATKNFKWANYSPIDADVNYYEGYFDSFIKPDLAITYTQWAYDVVTKYQPILKRRLHIIGHGGDTKNFFKLPDEEKVELRKEYFNVTDEFLILNVNSNQWRKHPMGTLVAFDEFRKKHANSKLYYHTNPQADGINLFGLMAQIKSKNHVKLPPAPYQVDRKTLNEIYNCADVLISTSLGEGWGLSTTEAFAAQVPVVVPDNSSFTEILGNGERGYLAKPEGWTVIYGHDHAKRPLVSIPSMVQGMERVLNKDPKIEEEVANGLAYVKENSWEKIGNQWIDLFKQFN